MKYIYRMTHIDNMPHILRYGITHYASKDANPEYVPIGNESLIDKRRDKCVITKAGQMIKLGDFMPFYFYARMPMLYNIQHGYGVPRTDPAEIVYIILPIADIVNDPDRTYYFSDYHAMCKMASFYGKESIGQIDHLLDVEAIINNNWGDDYITRERKQAEFLVKEDLPVNLIACICCYNDKAKSRLMSMLSEAGIDCKVIVSQKAYF